MCSRAWAQWLWHTSLAVLNMWNLPRAGSEPVSSALAGGLLTTGPSEKSLRLHFKKSCTMCYFCETPCPQGKDDQHPYKKLYATQLRRRVPCVHRGEFFFRKHLTDFSLMTCSHYTTFHCSYLWMPSISY